ncbi:NAD(P)/FAD-dependent oxidoreductase [Fibrella forsythiae]|uniref:FAD-binding oxidoreductase n=1 Tax=Fibrella forsythiae TaxID=2817061 RepID=A0ABS3JNC4_9BACT|nr:FAD-dependent oxidoreductase [Fibrella forsythiae]MBO0951480.1 FAD-binding oxidoreductase [Fibrella forsythiae]
MSIGSADVLIVGQGVAGSVLALTLQGRGLSVHIVSSPTLPSASTVAAGIVNPLTGRKLVKTWEADRLFPYLHRFYTGLESQLNTPFFTSLDVYRPYRDAKERTLYQTIAADPELQPYFQPAVSESAYSAVISNPFGGIQVTQAGWVDLPAFTKAVRGYFSDKQQFTIGQVLAGDLAVEPDSVTYLGNTYRYVIFCEGPHGQENAFFSALPYNVVKGEILTAEVVDYPLTNIVNQGIFVMPVSETRIRIGATYSWHELDWKTTDAGRSFLEMKARALLKIPFTVIDQQAGIRPSTIDRRPFVGWHQTYPAVGIFGGMGTKGVSLAPYLAHDFADHLLLGKEINPAVNISRFHSL